MSTALICIALLALLLFGLGFYVSLGRTKTVTAAGHSVKPEDMLYKRVRAHANTVEYVPMLAVLIYILGTMNPADWVVWCMILVTACRYLLAFGLLAYPTMAKPNLCRFIGALGTYIFGFALCIALLIQVFSQAIHG